MNFERFLIQFSITTSLEHKRRNLYHKGKSRKKRADSNNTTGIITLQREIEKGEGFGVTKPGKKAKQRN